MRAWPLIFVLLAVAIAAAVTVREQQARTRGLATAREHAAEVALSSVKETLDRHWKALADQASVLEANEQLRLGIATDAQTIQNQIAEEGLKSLRSRDLYAIGRIDPQNAGQMELLVARGFDQIPSETISAAPEVLAALASPSAPVSTGTFALRNGAALIAVSPVTSHDQLSRGYLMIGERVNRKSLETLAAETRTALLLSDGKQALGFGGSAGIESGVTALIGREAEAVGATLPDSSGTVATRAIELGPRLWLWTAESIAPEAETISRSATLNTVLAWILSLLVGGCLAGFLMWRSRPVSSIPDASALVSPASLWATGSGAPRTPAATLPGAITVTSGGTTPPQGSDAAIFGRYKLLDRLGSGGMAEVWTAVVFGAEGFRRPFVIKRIRRDMTDNTDLVQQFIDEANLASQLVHSNIVPVFDFGNLNGEYFLAQEYILGRDLGKVTIALAQRGERLDPALATYILGEILKALNYAHTLSDKSGQHLGIVHRDISPNNILCSMSGEVKLIDFGIAKSVSKVGQTEVGTVKGNLRFMSPEQAQGQPVDGRSDLFSLGMSLYFTQAGESLYTASGPYDLLLLAAKGPQAADLARVEALSPPLASLLRGALAPVLDHRYPSAQSFLEDVLPLSPSDGARRLAALVMDLFGDELKAQENRFSDAVRTASAAEPGQTGTRTAPGVRT